MIYAPPSAPKSKVYTKAKGGVISGSFMSDKLLRDVHYIKVDGKGTMAIVWVDENGSVLDTEYVKADGTPCDPSEIDSNL